MVEKHVKFIKKCWLEILHLISLTIHICHEIYEGVSLISINGTLEVGVTLTGIVSICSMWKKLNNDEH